MQLWWKYDEINRLISLSVIHILAVSIMSWRDFFLFYRVLENLLLQVESKEAGHVSTILAGRKEIQVLDTQFCQVAAILLVRHRPCVLQHHLRSRRTLRATEIPHRFPLWVSILSLFYLIVLLARKSFLSLSSVKCGKRSKNSKFLMI